MKRPYVRGSQTSREAAESVEPMAETMSAQIKGLLRDAGLDGLTCDECEVKTGGLHQTVSSTLKGLLDDKEIVIRRRKGKERTRLTRRGRKARIYRLRKEEL